MSIFTYKLEKNFCFAKFVKQNIDFSKPIDQSIIRNDAFRIRIFGSTEDSKKYWECGDGAVVDLMPVSY